MPACWSVPGRTGVTTLVTGAGGFIGGHVVRRLAAAGEPVRALDIAWGTTPPAGAERVTASILDPDALAAAMQGVRAVVHAAAIAHLWSPGRFDYDRVNGLGTARVLAAARRARARVVLVSSYVTLVDREALAGVDARRDGRGAADAAARRLSAHEAPGRAVRALGRRDRPAGDDRHALGAGRGERCQPHPADADAARPRGGADAGAARLRA